MNPLKDTLIVSKFVNFSGFFGESITNSSLSFTVLRNNSKSYTQIINPELSLLLLYKAIIFLKLFKKSQKQPLSILFLNANPNYNALVKLASKNQHVVYSKWVGGTLTNWQQISKSIRTFQAFQWKWKSLLKQRSFLFPQLEKMKKRYKGFYNPLEKQNDFKDYKTYGEHFFNLLFGKKRLARPCFRTLLKSPALDKKSYTKLLSDQMIPPKQLRKPQVLIVLDTYANRAAVEEAAKRQIPIIGFVNADSDIKGISYPIPGNNQNFFFIHFCLNFIMMVMQK